MNIHYAFSIRSDGGDDESDDDDEDVDKGGDIADDDDEDENLLFLFSREVSEVVDSDQTLQVILFLKSKQTLRKENIREGYMVPTWYALADLKFVKKFTRPHSLGQKFYTFLFNCME